jgi:hypothetical protein
VGKNIKKISELRLIEPTKARVGMGEVDASCIDLRLLFEFFQLSQLVQGKR